jgi:hypothetical protein
MEPTEAREPPAIDECVPPQECPKCFKKILGNRGALTNHMRACPFPDRRNVVVTVRQIHRDAPEPPTPPEQDPYAVFRAEELKRIAFTTSPHHFLAFKGLGAAWGSPASSVYRAAVLCSLQRQLWAPGATYSRLFGEKYGVKPVPGPRDARVIECMALRPPDPSVLMSGMRMARAFLARVAETTANPAWDDTQRRQTQVSVTDATRGAIISLCEMHIYQSMSDFVRCAVQDFINEYVFPYFDPVEDGFVVREME